MNYQDFESAWYLGLIVTGFFCVLLVALRSIFKHARQLAAEEGGAIAWMVVAGGVFTFLLVFGCCMALLIGIIGLAGG